MKRSFLLWGALFVFFSTLFLVRYHIVGQAVYGDGIYYWAYTRSLVIDNNLDLKNEGAHTYGQVTNNSFTKESHGSKQTNLSQNKYYPLGPSPLWIPTFFLVHFAITSLHILGYQTVNNGYSDFYQIVVGITNVGFVVFGLFLLYRLLQKFYSRFFAVTTTLLLLLATNLLYYGSIDVLNSHAASFLLCSSFTYLSVTRKEKLSNFFLLLLGVLLGLIAIVRLQDSLFAFLLISLLTQKMVSGKIKMKKISTYSFFFLFGAFMGFLPQLFVSKIIYHNFFLLPYTFGSGQFHLGENKILPLFLDPQKGLVFSSPVFLLGLVGIFLLHGKMKMFKLPFISVIIPTFLLVSVWSGWSQGESYGLRMFISLLPLIAFGLAEVLTRLSNYLSKTTIILISIFLVLHNLALITAFHLFFHNPTYVGDQLSQSGRLKKTILETLIRLVTR